MDGRLSLVPNQYPVVVSMLVRKEERCSTAEGVMLKGKYRRNIMFCLGLGAKKVDCFSHLLQPPFLGLRPHPAVRAVVSS